MVVGVLLVLTWQDTPVLPKVGHVNFATKQSLQLAVEQAFVLSCCNVSLPVCLVNDCSTYTCNRGTRALEKHATREV